MKICHLTSVHSRKDVRIYYKEIHSLKSNAYNVVFIVADGQGDCKENNIIDVGKTRNKIHRLLVINKLIIKKAIETNADIFHIHDPELIRFRRKLKKNEKKIIYDIHEDLPRQVLTKTYLNKIFPGIVSWIIEKWENHHAKNFDYLITSTKKIKERFLHINSHVESVMNFPLVREFDSVNRNVNKKNVTYIGGISRVRGISEIVETCYDLSLTLNIAGSFHDSDYYYKITNSPGWTNVNYLGFISRNEVSNLLSNSTIGIVTLHPTLSFVDSLPVKMFEYMIAGIPVIASNFPLWKEIVEDNNCGICVDPQNTNEIKKAIKYILDNPDIAETMGNNGKLAIKNKYNWISEEKKLLKIYYLIEKDK